MFAILGFACHTLKTSLSIFLVPHRSLSSVGTATLASSALPSRPSTADAPALARSLAAYPAEVESAGHLWILISPYLALPSPCQAAIGAGVALLQTSTQSGGALSQ